MELSHEVSEQLGYYVYLYIDPDTNKPFYVGKGTGTRALSHMSEIGESDKVNKIQEIRGKGKEPRIEILRYGLTENQAFLVEASAIDLVGTDLLTNKVRGDHSRTYGRISLNELLTTFTAEPVDITHKVLLITINKRYRSDMTPLELYEATRGVWVIGRRRDKVVYAFSVFRGIVREVYRIKQWYPAGTLHYETRDNAELKVKRRWEFDGQIATEVCDTYVGGSVRDYLGKYSQNPIRYINV